MRTTHKRSKRDVAASRQHLRDADAACQLSTRGDFVYPDQHLRVDNSRLTPAEAAARIAAYLSRRTA